MIILTWILKVEGGTVVGRSNVAYSRAEWLALASTAMAFVFHTRYIYVCVCVEFIV